MRVVAFVALRVASPTRSDFLGHFSLVPLSLGPQKVLDPHLAPSLSPSGAPLPGLYDSPRERGRAGSAELDFSFLGRALVLPPSALAGSGFPAR